MPTLPQAGLATAPPQDDEPGEAMPRRSWLASVAYRTLGRTGAIIGTMWVAVMVIGAVFAPFIASSHPYVWSRGGRVSSPLLEYLTAADLALLTAFCAAAVLAAMVWLPGRLRWGLWLATLGVTLPAIVWRTAWGDLRIDDPGSRRILDFAVNLGNPSSPWRIVLSLERLLDLLFYPAVGISCLLLAVLPPLLSLRRTGGRTWRVWAVGLAIVLPLSGALAWGSPDPPPVVVYSAYREALATGEAAWARFAPLAYSPNDRQRDVMAREGVDTRFLPPGPQHPLGTTEAGADVLSRMIHASRIALTIGLISTGIATVLGVMVGGVLGYFSGWLDLLGMRFVEIFSAIPVIFLLIMIVAFYGRDLYLIMTVLGLTGWVGFALYTRAEFLKLRKMDYVQAARAVGAPLHAILFRHMLPNGVTPVLVLVSFGIASAILTESTLSFLGLGLVEEPSWGAMLQESRRPGAHLGLLFPPGLAIFVTVFAYNLIGEALRDALDVRG